VAIQVLNSTKQGVWSGALPTSITITYALNAGDWVCLRCMSNGAVTAPTGWSTVGIFSSSGLSIFFIKVNSSTSSITASGISGSGEMTSFIVRGANSLYSTSANSIATTTAYSIGMPSTESIILSTTGSSGSNEFTNAGWTTLKETAWASDYYTVGYKIQTGGTAPIPSHTTWSQNDSYVIFTSVPPTGTTDSATTTMTGATVNGTVTSTGSQTTSTFFEYGTTVSYGSRIDTTTVSAGAASTAVSGSIIGLTRDTTYNYRFGMTNTSGTTYGVNRTFLTASGLALCSTQATTNIGVLTATLNGTITEFDETN
jgi:hypothetical protein